MKVNALLKRANIHLALDNEKLAQSDFEEAVKLNQRDPDVYFHRAQVRYRRGNRPHYPYSNSFFFFFVSSLTLLGIV